MFVLLTIDLYLVEWPEEKTPPGPGDVIQTDLGLKTVLRLLRDDAHEVGVPKWATALRADLETIGTMA